MATNPSNNGTTTVPESDTISATGTGTETDAASEPSQPQESAVRAAASKDSHRWPGWPGDSVFRLIVPVLKVGSIIGRKGELIKKMCEESRARIRILEGALGTSDRIVSNNSIGILFYRWRWREIRAWNLGFALEDFEYVLIYYLIDVFSLDCI